MNWRNWVPMRFDVEFWGGALLGLAVGIVVMLMVLG